MTGLLVSVRNAVEARIALEGGADVIDVKEPRRGSLGPADPQVWCEILDVVGGRATTSAALGEIVRDRTADRVRHAAGFRYVKAGLAHWNSDEEAKWQQTRDRLPTNVLLIPVVYADAQSAGWPSLNDEIDVALRLAAEAHSPLILIDTFDKSSGTLLDRVSSTELRSITHRAAALSIQSALAGSLDAAAIELLLPLNSAYIGVRGAACSGGRDGTIEMARVKYLAQIVRCSRQKAAC